MCHNVCVNETVIPEFGKVIYLISPTVFTPSAVGSPIKIALVFNFKIEASSKRVPRVALLVRINRFPFLLIVFESLSKLVNLFSLKPLPPPPYRRSKTILSVLFDLINDSI